MKLDFSTYPLDIYSDPASKALLSTIEDTIPSLSYSNLSLSQAIMSSLVRNFAGAGLLSLVDNIAIGMKGEQARKGLSNMFKEQAINIQKDPETLVKEAQINLMATACIMEYLTSMESGSWSNGVKNISKVLIGILSLENPLNVIVKSTMEICRKYEDICQVYHIAFLLNVYKANPNTIDVVKKLIIEALCKDSNSSSSFSTKDRPFLFFDSSSKSLYNNLKERIGFLEKETRTYNIIYDPFIKWYITER